MANIKTITVDMDKLTRFLNGTSCSSCPLLSDCVNDGRTCARTIMEDYLTPKKTYRITARVKNDFGYCIEATSEERAIEKVMDELRTKHTGDNCSIEILDCFETSDK